ncbi:MAG: alpha/beta fold hydrolase [Pseudomonadota bacterium]
MTTLLLLPGFDGTGHLFTPLVAALDDSFAVQTVGYNDSRTLAGYQSTVADACPKDDPVIVVAESFSGPIGLQFLAEAPDNVIGGVFSATFAKPPLALIISLAEKLRLASFTIPAVSEQILRWFCLNGVSDISLIKEITAVVRGVGGRTVQSRLAALNAMDATPVLSEIRAPLMTIAAGNDRVIRQRYMQPIVDSPTHQQHVTIDGPHLLLQTRAKQVAEAIQSFAGSL